MASGIEKAALPPAVRSRSAHPIVSRSQNMNTTYETKDFYLSSFLLATGHPLHGHVKQDGLTIFCFEDTPTLQDAVRRYYGFQAQVNPLTHGNAMRTLKSIIHENTNGTSQFHSRSGKVN